MHSNGSILLRESRISQAGNRGLGSAGQVANVPARWQHLTAQTVSYDASSPGVMAGAQDVVHGGLVRLAKFCLAAGWRSSKTTGKSQWVLAPK